MRNEFWNISDVEHIQNVEQHWDEFYYFFINVQKSTERELMFQNKRTGQYFYSDKEGSWNYDILKDNDIPKE